ncbi:MAG: hypothetical protein WBG90_08825 [Saonia sp.]
MNVKLLVGVILMIVLISCDKDDENNRFYWNQTKCADPWNTGENDSNEQTSIAISDFLEKEQITVLNLNFDSQSPLDSLCESCSCGTGQRIIIDVENADASKMKDLDFYQ